MVLKRANFRPAIGGAPFPGSVFPRPTIVTSKKANDDDDDVSIIWRNDIVRMYGSFISAIGGLFDPGHVTLRRDDDVCRYFGVFLNRRGMVGDGRGDKGIYGVR